METKKSNFFDKIMMAITFAEANEPEVAREVLKADARPVENEQRDLAYDNLAAGEAGS